MGVTRGTAEAGAESRTSRTRTLGRRERGEGREERGGEGRMREGKGGRGRYGEREGGGIVAQTWTYTHRGSVACTEERDRGEDERSETAGREDWIAGRERRARREEAVALAVAGHVLKRVHGHAPRSAHVVGSDLAMLGWMQWSATTTAGLGTVLARASGTVLVLDPEGLEVPTELTDARARRCGGAPRVLELAHAYASPSSRPRELSTVLVLNLEGRGARGTRMKLEMRGSSTRRRVFCRPRGGDDTCAGVDLLDGTGARTYVAGVLASPLALDPERGEEGEPRLHVHPSLERQHRSWRWFSKEAKGKPQ
ncbi:hypothetical protein DFH09DRAFT_527852 [Mycena vulgaris]|nr:hypothetical protein DFH09DRAFT_527852 [Mycena vulgaris]